jgi:C-terminal processing protease CtpA/Prc
VWARAGARIDAAERVWQLVAERFYDPRLNGVDWPAVRERTLARAAAAESDAQFYRELKAMVAELRDSHTEVLSPREAVDARRFVAARAGITLTLIDGQVVVLEVEPETPADEAGVRPGDIVLGINEISLDARFVRNALSDPSTERLDPAAGDGPGALPPDSRDADRVRVMRAVRRVLRKALGASPPSPQQEPAASAASAATDGSAFSLTLQGSDGKTVRRTLRAVPRARPPQAEFRMLRGEIALIRFTRFHATVRGELERALDRAASARAVVIDLRGNGGGLLELYRWFTGRFLADERIPMRTTRRDRVNPQAQTVTDMRVGPADRPLLQPVAVLIDGRTGSAAELAAVTLAEQRGAVLVGEPTCGCVVGVRVEYVLPDGGGVRIAETGFVSARGLRMESEPTLPAARVSPSVLDLRSGVDPVLEEALHRLSARLAGAVPASRAPQPRTERTVNPSR